jgi:hypothetical protein
MHEAVANGGPKRKPNSVLVSVTLKNDAIGSDKPNANAFRAHIPISYPNALRLGFFPKLPKRRIPY